MIIGYYRRSEHDLCGISISKAAAASPRQRDGLRGCGTGRSHCAVARQSHVVVPVAKCVAPFAATRPLHRNTFRSEEHTSELQSHSDLVCRLLLEKKKKKYKHKILNQQHI